MEKKRITDRINITPNIFLTYFDEAARLLIEQKEILEKEGWSDIRLDMEDYWDSSELVVMGTRLETDGELKRREKEEEKKLIFAKKKLEREREKYEKLKKKFDS